MRLRNLSILSICLVAVSMVSLAADKPVVKKRLVSPYSAEGKTWLRGNVHTHTTQSDGQESPQDVVNGYAKLGYDFLMISDHDQITPVDGLDAKGMTLISGNEISAKGPHLLHVGTRTRIAPDPDRQKVLDQIGQDGGIAVMNHPNWGKNYNHCDLAVLEKLQGYAGIEIFNGVIIYLEGYELATDKWDRLLTKGRRIYGFATDDCHELKRLSGLGWQMVQSDSRAADDIVDAMRNGRSYASTGVIFDMIKVEGVSISVRASNAQHFRVISDNGIVLQMTDGPTMEFTVKPDAKCTYIRVEGYGVADQTAWLQPMFLE